MSELKEHLFCECDECIHEYRGPLSNEMRPYYLKSEADKVIAEKDEELRHHKCKRCLAMGHRCQNAQYYFSVLQDNEASKINSNTKTFKELNRKCKFYARWRARWFMIADNFKEAK